MAQLYRKDLSGAPQPNSRLGALTVASYSRHAFGGPKLAQLTFAGAPELVAQALGWLRCPVEIYNERLEILWHGFVEEVRLTLSKVEVGLSLDPMANSVTVVYVKTGSLDTVGAQAVTAAQTDAPSIAEFGTKELRVSLSNAADDEAVGRATQDLAALRYPQGIGPVFGGSVAGASAVIECRGWWDTLRWQYYSHANDEESCTSGTAWAPADSRWGVIVAPNPQVIATKFSIAGGSPGWYLQSATADIYLDPNNLGATATSFDIYCELYSDVAGVPSALLQSSTPINTTVFPVDTWPVWTFSPVYLLTAGTVYWLRFRVSLTAGSATNVVPRFHGASGTPYARGGYASYNGAWTTDTTKTILFRSTGIQDTATQLQHIISGGGQFMIGSQQRGMAGSSVYSSELRAGERTALDEAEELMHAGNSDFKRILSKVTPVRMVDFSPEPDPASPAYQIDGQMRLYDAFGGGVDRSKCPAGEWCALKDVLPGGGLLPAFASPSPFFIEEGRYEVATDRYTPTPKSEGNIYRHPPGSEVLSFIKPYVVGWR